MTLKGQEQEYPPRKGGDSPPGRNCNQWTEEAAASKSISCKDEKVPKSCPRKTRMDVYRKVRPMELFHNPSLCPSENKFPRVDK